MRPNDMRLVVNPFRFKFAVMRTAVSIAVVLLASAAFVQPSPESQSRSPRRVWAPPHWNFPEHLKANITKEMFSTLRVASYEVILEKTSKKDAQKRLGGKLGQKGDAGESARWLCFHGADAIGDWAFWLESGEIDGEYVGSFQWQRLAEPVAFDSRCRDLTRTTSPIELPVSLALGASEIRSGNNSR